MVVGEPTPQRFNARKPVGLLSVPGFVLRPITVSFVNTLFTSKQPAKAEMHGVPVYRCRTPVRDQSVFIV